MGWEGSTLFYDLWEEFCELFLALFDGSGRKVIREAVFWNMFSLCRCLPDLFDSFSVTDRAELLSILFLLWTFSSILLHDLTDWSSPLLNLSAPNIRACWGVFGILLSTYSILLCCWSSESTLSKLILKFGFHFDDCLLKLKFWSVGWCLTAPSLISPALLCSL